MAQGADGTKALFELAGFEVQQIWELMNQYWPRVQAYYPMIIESPWFLVQTEIGLIKFGPRKRVWEIDWSATKVRCTVTTDDVTHGREGDLVHAWTMAKALEYLTSLKNGGVRREE